MFKMSRFRNSEEEATRDVSWLEKNGAEDLEVKKAKSGIWRIAAMVPANAFARFCSIEAERK